MRAGWVGSRSAWSKSTTASKAPPSRIQALTVWRLDSRAGVQAPTRKVSSSYGVKVAPKILMSRVRARTASCFRPAIIASAVTSSSGLAQRLRRSLVPSITIACVTPGWTSTSRSNRRSPLSPRMSCRIRLPPSPWFMTAIGRPPVRACRRRESWSGHRQNASIVEMLASVSESPSATMPPVSGEANISTIDAFCRWPDQLSRRLQARAAGRPMGVMNQGLGGNRILHDIRGDSGLRRFDRDVLAQPGVTHATVMLGTNDLRNRWAKPEEEVTAEEMISGLKQLAMRARTRGIKIFGATLTPFENETFLPGAWTPERESKRQAVNAWIRDGGAFDAVVDFDKALRDPDHPTRMLPICDCGDHLHPSDLGYNTMGDAIDLSLFE